MKHIPNEELQRYLTGEMDLVDQAAVEAHMAECSECSEELAALAAEDALLREAVALTPEEEAWAAGIDLTEPVLMQLTPWTRHPVVIATGIILAAAAAWGVQEVAWQLEALFLAGRAAGVAARAVSIGLWLVEDLADFMAQGGLLPVLWPAAAVGLLFWLRHRGRREEHDYA